MLLRFVEQLSDLVSPCESVVQTPVPQSYVPWRILAIHTRFSGVLQLFVLC